ncbi:MAG: hypothetical protein ACWGMZ_08770, partial [Thermoguttaceae bacterium]
MDKAKPHGRRGQSHFRFASPRKLGQSPCLAHCVKMLANGLRYRLCIVSVQSAEDATMVIYRQRF